MKQASNMLAAAFYDNPMFVYLFPDDKKRKKVLSLTFPIVVRMLNGLGHVYVTSDSVEGIFCVRRHGRARSKRTLFQAVLYSVLSFPKLMTSTSLISFYKRALKLKGATEALNDFTSTYKDFIIVDSVAVDPTFRGQKFMSRLMRAVIEEVHKTHTFCVLQTETATNVNIYQHFGFALVRNIPVADGAFTTYVLAYDPFQLTQTDGEKQNKR